MRLKMKPPSICVALFVPSCSSTPGLKPPVALSDAILPLPSQAVSGMSDTGRRNYLEDKSGDYDANSRRLHLYGDDWKGRWFADAMLFLRLFEDGEGRTIAASHSARPHGLGQVPSASDTLVLRLERGRWVDITSSVLPEAVPRSWWFRFDGDGESIPCGPYIELPPTPGRDKPYYRHEEPAGELLWQGDRFHFKPKN